MAKPANLLGIQIIWDVVLVSWCRFISTIGIIFYIFWLLQGIVVILRWRVFMGNPGRFFKALIKFYSSTCVQYQLLAVWLCDPHRLPVPPVTKISNTKYTLSKSLGQLQITVHKLFAHIYKLGHGYSSFITMNDNKCRISQSSSVTIRYPSSVCPSPKIPEAHSCLKSRFQMIAKCNVRR